MKDFYMKFIFLIIFSLLVIGNADAIGINSCINLVNNTEYTITSNISFSDYVCLNLPDNPYNIIISCASNTGFIGDGLPGNVAIESSYNGAMNSITIHDCFFINVSSAISLNDNHNGISSNINIYNNKIYNVIDSGISFFNGALSAYTNNLNIYNNYINNSLTDGMFIYGSSATYSIQNSSIFNNNISNSVNYGLTFQSLSYSNLVYNNIVDGFSCGGYGDGTTKVYNNDFRTGIVQSSCNISFNTSKNCTINNIVNGDCIGGNIYSSSDFICISDSNNDGICDNPDYHNVNTDIDYLPLGFVQLAQGNIVYSCQNAGNLCSLNISTNDIDILSAYLTSGSNPVANPIVQLYENINDFKIINVMDSGATNVIGSSNYSVTTSAVEGTGAISIVKNQATSIISFDKSVSMSILDSDSEFMFSHFWLYIPASIINNIDDADGIKIFLGNLEMTSYYTILMNSDSLNVGWNLISERDAYGMSRDYTTTNNPSTNIQKIRIEIDFTSTATYTDALIFDYAYAQKFKMQKDGYLYGIQYSFDTAETHTIQLNMSSYGQTNTETISIDVSPGATSNLAWVTTPPSNYDMSSGAQELCLNYTSSGNAITGATCDIFTTSAETETLGFDTAFKTPNYCADITYFINANYSLQGVCTAPLYASLQTSPLVYTLVNGSNYSTSGAIINVESWNYKYFDSDMISGTETICALDYTTQFKRCCDLNAFNGKCTINLPYVWIWTQSNTRLYALSVPSNNWGMMINPLSIKNGVYEQDILFAYEPDGSMATFTLKNNVTDCNVTGYAGTLYTNETVRFGNEAYECSGVTCSNMYFKGFAHYITNDDTTSAGWFWIANTSWKNLVVLQKHVIECNNSNAGVKYCTPSERFSSPDEMLSTMTTNYSQFPAIVNLVEMAYSGLTEFIPKWNGVQPDDIKFMGSVVECDRTCNLKVQACYGTCDSNNNCVPYSQKKNFATNIFGFLSKNENDYPIFWLIISVFASAMCGVYARDSAGMVASLVMVGMLLIGGAIGVLPIWMSATMVMFVLLAFVGVIFYNSIKSGG